eukprot:scaffold21834_cov123-Isochrysis_galbana.AAC.3
MDVTWRGTHGCHMARAGGLPCDCSITTADRGSIEVSFLRRTSNAVAPLDPSPLSLSCPPARLWPTCYATYTYTYLLSATATATILPWLVLDSA